MRFDPDSYAASTFETDENGNEIAGSEEQIDSGNIQQAVQDRAMLTPADRFVVGELWSVDSRRPAMQLLGKPMKVRGRLPVPDGDVQLPV